jgi:hypothetical protein
MPKLSTTLTPITNPTPKLINIKSTNNTLTNFLLIILSAPRSGGNGQKTFSAYGVIHQDALGLSKSPRAGLWVTLLLSTVRFNPHIQYFSIINRSSQLHQWPQPYNYLGFNRALKYFNHSLSLCGAYSSSDTSLANFSNWRFNSTIILAVSLTQPAHTRSSVHWHIGVSYFVVPREATG